MTKMRCLSYSVDKAMAMLSWTLHATRIRLSNNWWYYLDKFIFCKKNWTMGKLHILYISLRNNHLHLLKSYYMINVMVNCGTVCGSVCHWGQQRYCPKWLKSLGILFVISIRKVILSLGAFIKMKHIWSHGPLYSRTSLLRTSLGLTKCCP
jgi:hypothetical protein